MLFKKALAIIWYCIVVYGGFYIWYHIPAWFNTWYGYPTVLLGIVCIFYSLGKAIEIIMGEKSKGE